jgi:hypothetical protein
MRAGRFPWVGDAGEVGEELRAGIDDAEVDVEMVAEGGLDEVPLVLAQQACVHEDAGEAVADGLVQEAGADGGIDAAGETADDAAGADLFAGAGGGGVDESAMLRRSTGRTRRGSPGGSRRRRRAHLRGTARRRTSWRRDADARRGSRERDHVEALRRRRRG